jgi:hypothetical protein
MKLLSFVADGKYLYGALSGNGVVTMNERIGLATLRDALAAGAMEEMPHPARTRKLGVWRPTNLVNAVSAAEPTSRGKSAKGCENRPCFCGSPHQCLVGGDSRHYFQAAAARPPRSPGRCSLPAPRLEWCGLLRAGCSGSPELEPLASRGRRHPLLDRRHLSCVEELAVLKRDLAWLRTGRRMLPLFGRSRLCGVCAGLSRDVLLSQIIPASKKID